MKNPSVLILALAALFLPACESAPQSGHSQVPSVIFEAPPQYPFELHKQGKTGSATVDFIVTTQGDVANAFAIAATEPEFGQAAVAAVSRWKFKPGIRNGVAVNTHLQVPVYFTLTPDLPAPAAQVK